MQFLGLVSSCRALHPISIKGCWEKEVADYQQCKKRSFINYWTPPLMAAIFSLSPVCFTPVEVAQAVDIQRGATLFNKACIGCHVGGGNIIQPGSTLFAQDLQRNGAATEETIYEITYYGKGRMPGFGEKCTPRGQCTFGPRLQDDEIRILAEFVKAQADSGWPNVEAIVD